MARRSRPGSRAMDELTEPGRYPRWLATAGAAGFALSVAMLLSGTWLTCVLCRDVWRDRPTGPAAEPDQDVVLPARVFGAGIATLVAVAAYLIAGPGSDRAG